MGCDSIATLNITIENVTPIISQSGDSLFASILPDSILYSTEWYNINKNTEQTWLMSTNNYFKPKFDCYYFIITESEFGCSDTSDIYYYGQFASSIQSLDISPNPTDGLLKVRFENDRNQFVRILLLNSNGKTLNEFVTKENELNIDISNYTSGMYYVYFTSEKQTLSSKIILNK